jgi:hypothetical protein
MQGHTNAVHHAAQAVGIETVEVGINLGRASGVV